MPSMEGIKIMLIKFFKFNKLFFVIKTQYTVAKPDVRNIGSIKYSSGMKKFKTTAKLPIKNNETSG